MQAVVKGGGGYVQADMGGVMDCGKKCCKYSFRHEGNFIVPTLAFPILFMGVTSSKKKY